MRSVAAAAVVLAMVAAACTGSAGDTATTTSTPAPATSAASTGTGPAVIAIAEPFDLAEVRFVAALERFDECDAFLSHIKAEATNRVGPYGLGQTGGLFPVARFAEEAEFFGDASRTTSFAAAVADGGQAGVDFSGSNVQVLGVDEPDIVKTDGSRILAVVDGTLHYVDVSGAEPRLAGSLFLGEGFDHRLFMSGDRALVFANTFGGPGPVRFAAELTTIFPASAPTMVITEVDLSDPGNLRAGNVLHLQGSFISARAVGTTVRVVSSSFPAGLAFVYPSGPEAEQLATETNRRVIAESTIETWLPTFVLSNGDQILDEGVVADCDRIHRPAEFAGFDMISVLTLDLGEPLSKGAATTVIARGQTVYSSAEALYVATNVWIPGDAVQSGEADVLGDRYQTALHKFDVAGDGPAEYLASGSVRGRLVNQFSLGDYDGRLHVATTDGPPWGAQEDSESFVSVFEEQGDRLVRVGQVGDLGRGERIFSARFIEDRAYVVTFRQVDPLYVIDLSDPAAPTVTGELKIPGFSSYLHPIGDDRLLGVGQDATGEGFTTGAKVSLFDVSDPTAPTEVDTWVLGGGFSDVEWDHLAFLYWPPEGVAVLPVQSYETDFHGAVVLHVDGDLHEHGRVNHEPPVVELGLSDCRQVTAEDVGDPEFGLFQEEIRVQVCGDDQRGGASGYFCERISTDELQFFGPELSRDPDVDITEIVGDGERLEFCYLDFDDRLPILRSLVIGDTLWTLSRRALQANALDGLDRTVVQLALS